MAVKKQGRRSAETSEETKRQILCVAGDLFSEFGYERVSLRNISEQAGVSHSLLRHHFGSKEDIWYAVSDALHSFLIQYIHRLAVDISGDKPAYIKFYHFSVRLLALLLVEPKPIQFIADTVRQEGKFSDYFLDKRGDEEPILLDWVESYNAETPENLVDLWEVKWLLINSAHAAASLKPLLNIIWEKQTSDPQQALYKHWELFNKQMVIVHNIPEQEVLSPSALKDLLLPYKCEMKLC